MILCYSKKRYHTILGATMSCLDDVVNDVSVNLSMNVFTFTLFYIVIAGLLHGIYARAPFIVSYTYRSV